MPGFGSGGFGHSGSFGSWSWAYNTIIATIPEIYRNQDATVGSPMVGMLECVTPTMDKIRLKIQDLGNLRDPLLAQTNETYRKLVPILQVDDLGDGTSRVFLSQGALNDTFTNVAPGYVLEDFSGNTFSVTEVGAAGLAADFISPPIDPATGLPTGKHVVVNNISQGAVTAIPLVNGLAIVDENPTPVPPDNGANLGPYVFTLASLPVANKIELSWTVGGIAYYGFFDNKGAYSGLSTGSSVVFATGVVTLAIGLVAADADSIRVSYTAVAGIADPSNLSSQNLLAFLAQDYNTFVDHHDPEVYQRSLVNDIYQIWGIKGTADGYKYMGQLCGYTVVPKNLYKIALAYAAILPADRVWELPPASGDYYTDVKPYFVLFDEVPLDHLPLDEACFDPAFPAPHPGVAQPITVDTVDFLYNESSGHRYRLGITAAAGEMYKSFGVEGYIQDITVAQHSIQKYTWLSNTTYEVEVWSTGAPPVVGAGFAAWYVLPAPSATPGNLQIGYVTSMGPQYSGYSGTRYSVRYSLSGLPELTLPSLGSWYLIDYNGVVSVIEKVTDMGGLEYLLEIVAPSAPPVSVLGREFSVFYKCHETADCSFCAASAIALDIAPDDILNYPDSFAGSYDRLLQRENKLLPVHVSAALYNYSASVPTALLTMASASDLLSGAWNNQGMDLWHLTAYRVAPTGWSHSWLYGHNEVGVFGGPGAVKPEYVYPDPPGVPAASIGSVRTPPIATAGLSNIVEFDLFADLRAGLLDDVFYIMLVDDTGVFLGMVADKVTTGIDVTGNTGGLWVHYTFDVSALAPFPPVVKVHVSFETLTIQLGAEEGLYISNIQMT